MSEKENGMIRMGKKKNKKQKQKTKNKKKRIFLLSKIQTTIYYSACVTRPYLRVSTLSSIGKNYIV